MNPRVRTVGGDYPKPFDLTVANAVDDLVVSPARLRRNAIHRHPKRCTDTGAMLGIGEVMSTDEARHVGVESRAHGVALTGDAVRTGAGPADVAGDQGEVDDGLGRAGRFVTLINAHRPPERHAFPAMDRRSEFLDGFHSQARGSADRCRRKLLHEFRELREALRAPRDVVVINPFVRDQQMSDAVEQREIALGQKRVVARCRHGRLGFARIHDDDFGLVRVEFDSLPHNRMGNARIGADEDQHIALLEISIGERRGIEAEGLFIGDMSRGHALARVAVAVQSTHAEFKKAAEQCHLLGANLTGAEKRNAVRPMTRLNIFHLRAEFLHRDGPVDRLHRSVHIAQQRSRSAIRRRQRRERFPAFRTGHAEIDWVMGVGTEIDGLAIFQVDVQPATRGAEAADHRRGAVRLESRRDLSETEITGMQNQILGEWTCPLTQQCILLGSGQAATPPGIPVGATAVKNK